MFYQVELSGNLGSDFFCSEVCLRKVWSNLAWNEVISLANDQIAGLGLDCFTCNKELSSGRFALVRNGKEIGKFQYSFNSFRVAQPGDILRDTAFGPDNPHEYLFYWVDQAQPPCLAMRFIERDDEKLT